MQFSGGIFLWVFRYARKNRSRLPVSGSPLGKGVKASHFPTWTWTLTSTWTWTAIGALSQLLNYWLAILGE